MVFYNEKKKDDQEWQTSEFEKLCFIGKLFIQNDSKIGQQEQRKSKLANFPEDAKQIIYPVWRVRIYIDLKRNQYGKYFKGNTDPSDNHQMAVGQGLLYRISFSADIS